MIYSRMFSISALLFYHKKLNGNRGRIAAEYTLILGRARFVRIHAGEAVLADSADCVPRGFRSDPVNPLKTGPAVETTVEAQNRSNAMAFHDRNMHGVAGG